MDTVQVELPAALVKAADLDIANVSQEASRLLALELFRENRISLGRAAELSGTPLASFMDFVAMHGVPPLRYDFDDLERERLSSNADNKPSETPGA
jgi:predicted HTH domain antitoxin